MEDNLSLRDKIAIQVLYESGHFDTGYLSLLFRKPKSEIESILEKKIDLSLTRVERWKRQRAYENSLENNISPF